VMGAEGAAPIIFRKELEAAADSGTLLEEKVREYREKFANPYLPATHLHVDDVIDPADTRRRLVDALEMAIDKQEERPQKKHGVMPT
jgi:acetyl-CoA carboxylase carboxyltransferase component